MNRRVSVYTGGPVYRDRVVVLSSNAGFGSHECRPIAPFAQSFSRAIRALEQLLVNVGPRFSTVLNRRIHKVLSLPRRWAFQGETFALKIV
jgi:hypothetical protein